MEVQALMFFWLIGGIPFLYVLIRAVLPLRIRIGWKLALAALLFAVAFKFQIIRRFAGPMFFAPRVPNWILVLAAWAFTSLCFFLVFLIAADLVRLALWAARRLFRLPENSRRAPFAAFVNLALLAAACVVTAWGMSNAAAPPEIRTVAVTSAALPPGAEGTKIVLLADLHIDRLTPDGEIAEAVRRANALGPDIAVIAGDFADGTVAELRAKAAPLAQLRATHGVFGVPGNHEYYSGYREWLTFLRSLGIVMLENEHRVLPGGIVLAGITDPAAKLRNMELPDVAKAFSGAPEESFRILLAHQLKHTREAAETGVDIQLSGHTHGGMVRGLDKLVACVNGGFVADRYQVGDMFLYVNRGTNLWKGYPVRLGVPAEITLITLHRK